MGDEKKPVPSHDHPHAQGVVHPLKAYDQIAQWERVWTEAIAFAWKDWDAGEHGFREKLKADPRAAVREKFGFSFPDDCELVVREGKSTDWKWHEDSMSWSHPRAISHLALTLPFRPDKPDDRAVALSNYVATGQSMPFTCCFC
jgi:ribosomally synthesized peptide (two-chain TOMM family)